MKNNTSGHKKKRNGNSYFTRSIPKFKRSIKIGSGFIQHALHRTLMKFSPDTFYLSVTIYNIPYISDEKKNNIEELIYKHMDRVDDFIKTELERTNKMIVENGYDTPDYTDVETISVDIWSPLAHRYIDTLTTADKLSMQYDSLWMYGQMSNESRATCQKILKGKMMKSTNFFRKLVTELKAFVEKNADNDNVLTEENKQVENNKPKSKKQNNVIPVPKKKQKTTSNSKPVDNPKVVVNF